MATPSIMKVCRQPCADTGYHRLSISPLNVQADARPMSTALPQAVRSRLDSPDRLAAVARLGLVGTPHEEAFDRLTRLAARVLGVRGALVTVTTAEVQFCKSSVGLPEPWATSGLPVDLRSVPVYGRQRRTAPRQPMPAPIPGFSDNPGVRELGVAGYAGVPLLTTDGQAIGAFCAFDDRPRTWTAEDLQTLAGSGRGGHDRGGATGYDRGDAGQRSDIARGRRNAGDHQPRWTAADRRARSGDAGSGRDGCGDCAHRRPLRGLFL